MVTPLIWIWGGLEIATTRLIPLHAGKGKSIADALGRSTDYVENPEKTNDGELIAAYACDPLTVADEFLFSKREYAAITGRNQGANDVIAYHLRQSFKPGEIDPETANKIGYDLALSLTKGKHAFIVCTHVDKAHVHSHIIFNSTRLEHDRKFRNFLGSSFAVRRISDRLCVEHGLSIIENPKPSRGHYGTWLGDEKQPTQRDKLRDIISASISDGMDFDDFISTIEAAGCEVKQGKHLSIKPPGAERFLRCKSLGDDYTEDAIRERLSGKRIAAPKQHASTPEKVTLLIDIQSKIQRANSPGFEKWAALFNLKESAKTLIFLQENGLVNYADLEQEAAASSKQFSRLSGQIKQAENRMQEITTLQQHIGNYSKTREVYRQYKASGWNKNYRAQHDRAIQLHQSAKRHFDSLGLKKLPTINMLKQEYASLFADKKKMYSAYKSEREKMVILLTAKNNVDRLLGTTPIQQIQQEERR